MRRPVICDWYFFWWVGAWGGFFNWGDTHGVLVVRRVTPELSFSFSETKIDPNYHFSKGGAFGTSQVLLRFK